MTACNEASVLNNGFDKLGAKLLSFTSALSRVTFIARDVLLNIVWLINGRESNCSSIVSGKALPSQIAIEDVGRL